MAYNTTRECVFTRDELNRFFCKGVIRFVASICYAHSVAVWQDSHVQIGTA